MIKKIERQKKEEGSLTAVTHHVRSPIYILKGYLEAIFSGEVGELGEKQKEYIKICVENVDRMSFIINSIIDMMEIDEGEYIVKKDPVDIVSEIKKVMEDSFSLAKASNTEVFFEKEKESIFVLTDKQKINEVVDIFLGNARKYKKQNKGKIEIKVEERENEVICFIKDNGIGVPEEEREKIFNKFYRTKEAIRIDPNSMGMNLFICKNIVKLSGGNVWVEGNEEGGSTFFFTLPLYKSEN